MPGSVSQCTFSKLAVSEMSLYLAMKVLMNQVLNHSFTGPSALTKDGSIAYTGLCIHAERLTHSLL